MLTTISSVSLQEKKKKKISHAVWIYHKVAGCLSDYTLSDIAKAQVWKMSSF